MNNEHDIWVIIKKMYSSCRPDADYSCVGTPCWGWDDAIETLRDKVPEGIWLSDGHYINDGAMWYAVDTETGEVLGEWIIKRVGAF